MCTHVLKTRALVILQQAVLAAKLAITEATLTHDPLHLCVAVVNGTFGRPLGSHVDVWGSRLTELM